MGNLFGSFKLGEFVPTGKPPKAVKSTCFIQATAVQDQDDGQQVPVGSVTWFGGCNELQVWTMRDKAKGDLFGYFVGCPSHNTARGTPESAKSVEHMPEDHSIRVECKALPLAFSVTFLRQLAMSVVIIAGCCFFIWGLLKLYRMSDSTTESIFNT